MKLLALGPILIGSLLATGCIIEGSADSSDDFVDDIADEPAPEDGAITATVSLSSFGGGAVGACQGGDAIRMIYTDTADNTTIELYDCTDTTITSAVLAGGDYTVLLDYVNDAGTPDPSDDLVVGTTTALPIYVDGGAAISADIELDKGFLAASWALEDQGGNPLMCSDVFGENGVSILGTLIGTGTGYESIYNCEDGNGFSEALPLGDYVVLLDVLDGSDLSLGTSGELPASIPEGNDYDDLGLVTITID